MRAKDRATAIIFTSANGSVKIPIAVIGKSGNPRQFRNEAPSCYKITNSKALSNTFYLRSGWTKCL